MMLVEMKCGKIECVRITEKLVQSIRDDFSSDMAASEILLYFQSRIRQV